MSCSEQAGGRRRTAKDAFRYVTDGASDGGRVCPRTCKFALAVSSRRRRRTAPLVVVFLRLADEGLVVRQPASVLFLLCRRATDKGMVTRQSASVLPRQGRVQAYALASAFPTAAAQVDPVPALLVAACPVVLGMIAGADALRSRGQLQERRRKGETVHLESRRTQQD